MLNYTRGQRNGLIVLSILILISLFIPKLYTHFFSRNYISSFSEFEKEIDAAKKERKQYKSGKREIELFNFNPNLLGEDKFRLLGLSDKQIKQILNYRSKGGFFYDKESFNKIYAIDDSTYNRLEAYIVIPKQNNRKKTNNKSNKRKFPKQESKKISVEINSVKLDNLQKVKGLALVLSKRIIKYRDALGGFIEKEQLLDVYGIDQEKYNNIQSQITVKSTLVKPLNVNFVSANILKKHPYIGQKRAKKIIKDRTFNGRFKNIHDIQKRMNWTDDYIKKIEVYIVF